MHWSRMLCGIPSIVFGLFGMALFVKYMGFGDSILAGSLTLGLLCVPLVIRTTEEALKAIPDSFREGSLALGATKLQTEHNGRNTAQVIGHHPDKADQLAINPTCCLQ